MALGFLEGGGEVGALMRAHDWSTSPLGPPEAWPQSLRSVVGLLQNSQFPMFVAWGKDLGFLYNDAYADILGAKHPRALGARFYDIWSEIWDDISPLIDAAMAGQASYREDLPLVMNRKGFDEQTGFTFSYSPVRDESGHVAGMFCAVSETTRRIIVERALRDSEARLRGLNETLEQRVADVLAERTILAEIVEKTDARVQVADLAYRWLAINRAACDGFERIFGVRPRVGDSMLELLADQPEQQAAVKAVWARALAGEQFTEHGLVESAADSDDAGLVRATADATPVLLVDDEELVRAGTADMLSGAGYSVTQASSGYQALELLRSGHPTEVLIADYAMPGMTGVDLAHEARALRPGLRVLLITGYATVADREAGGLPRLAKPFRHGASGRGGRRSAAGAVRSRLLRTAVIALERRRSL